MLFGRLKAAGYHVPVERIAASYLRVHGAPGSFGGRAVHRRAYHVAGANSLWHHDGQHGKPTSIYHLYVLTLPLLFRLDSLQDRNPLLYRWQISLCSWNQGQQ